MSVPIRYVDIMMKTRLRNMEQITSTHLSIGHCPGYQLCNSKMMIKPFFYILSVHGNLFGKSTNSRPSLSYTIVSGQEIYINIGILGYDILPASRTKRTMK